MDTDQAATSSFDGAVASCSKDADACEAMHIQYDMENASTSVANINLGSGDASNVTATSNIKSALKKGAKTVKKSVRFGNVETVYTKDGKNYVFIKKASFKRSKYFHYITICILLYIRRRL